jgi:hypothetical protein
MANKENECFIQPEFSKKKYYKKHSSKSPNRPQQKFPNGTMQEEEDDDYYNTTNPTLISKKNSNSDKTFMDTLKEHKILIITFAIVIILLVCIMVWITSRGDKSLVGKQPVKKPPQQSNNPPNQGNQPVNTPTDVQGNSTVGGGPVSTPVVGETPNTERKKDPKKDSTSKISETTEEKTMGHIEIEQTVDDEELMKYMNVGNSKEESEEENEEESEED